MERHVDVFAPNSVIMLEVPLSVKDKALPRGNIDVAIISPGVDAIFTTNIDDHRWSQTDQSWQH